MSQQRFCSPSRATSSPPPSTPWPSNPGDLPIFLTQAQLADLLAISIRTLERQRHDGESIPFRKVGRRILYGRDDVLRHLDACAYRSTAETKQGGDQR